MRRRQIFAMQSNVTNEVKHEIEEKASETPEEVLKIKPCPKCGKVLARGWYAHQKFCKG
jgi:hypothetical protein